MAVKSDIVGGARKKNQVKKNDVMQDSMQETTALQKTTGTGSLERPMVPFFSPARIYTYNS
jgi:hypothetical protein